MDNNASKKISLDLSLSSIPFAVSQLQLVDGKLSLTLHAEFSPEQLVTALTPAATPARAETPAIAAAPAATTSAPEATAPEAETAGRASPAPEEPRYGEVQPDVEWGAALDNPHHPCVSPNDDGETPAEQTQDEDTGENAAPEAETAIPAEENAELTLTEENLLDEDARAEEAAPVESEPPQAEDNRPEPEMEETPEETVEPTPAEDLPDLDAEEDFDEPVDMPEKPAPDFSAQAKEEPEKKPTLSYDLDDDDGGAEEPLDPFADGNDGEEAEETEAPEDDEDETLDEAPDAADDDGLDDADGLDEEPDAAPESPKEPEAPDEPDPDAAPVPQPARAPAAESADSPENPEPDDLPPPVPSKPKIVRVRYKCPRCGTDGTADAAKIANVITCRKCGRAMRLKLK